MNPSDANSSLATLRQLKEMLDAGTLTPQEFEALKQKLIFGQNAAPEAPAPIVPESTFVPPVAVSEAIRGAPLLPGEASIPTPAETPAWRAAPTSVPADEAPVEIEEEAQVNTQRNPLNLVFAIGGALVFLAVVLYLTLGNRGPDEHLTSTTQTAADSARVAPEIGPQAQQLTLPPAAPETVRVAPAVPVVVAPAATRFSADSAAATPAAPAVTPARPASATPVAADSAI